MLLRLLAQRSLCRCHTLLTGCVLTRRCHTPRTLLHSQTEHVLRKQSPPHFNTQSRRAKSQNRKFTGQEEQWKTRNKTVLTYIAAAVVGMVGLSYAAVPLYRLYCQVWSCLLSSAHSVLCYVCHVLCSVHQASGLGGTAVPGHDTNQVEIMKPVNERVVKVTFNADRHASMQWNFRPQQSEIFVSTCSGPHSGPTPGRIWTDDFCHAGGSW